MFTDNTVTVVTAATGHPELPRCLASVQRQTFADLEHVVVADGPERAAAVRAAVEDVPSPARPLRLLPLPHATGKQGWCGHRIYAALSFLANSEFVTFLDEDNWAEADHVASLVAAVRGAGAEWGFCLRNIYEGGDFVARDECESLGTLHPVFHSKHHHHVDTNCYLLRRETAVRFAGAWYGPTRPGGGKPAPDTLLCTLLMRHSPPGACSRRHTLNYAVGNRPDSVRADFFLRGNRAMRQAYPQGLPWERDDPA